MEKISAAADVLYLDDLDATQSSEVEIKLDGERPIAVMYKGHQFYRCQVPEQHPHPFVGPLGVIWLAISR